MNPWHCRISIPLLVLTVLVSGRSAHADEAAPPALRTHSVFQSNMVVQRDKPIAIWGWAAPGATVTVKFADQQGVATAADDGAWKAQLPALPASSEPRTMTITTGDDTLTYTNILLGDIWVLGGQSNMEQPISNCENGQLEIASANFPNIRLLSVIQRSGPEHATDWAIPQDRSRGVWEECSPQTVPSMSAIGYVFVRRIHMATQIPIGVIDASRWGTSVEAWTPLPVLRKIDSAPVSDMLGEWDAKVEGYSPEKALAARIAAFNARTERMRAEGQDVSNRTPPTDPPDNPNADFNYPGNCYAGMIAPLEGLAVKGAIFHQGFNNATGGTPGAVLYRQVFPEMINAWRAAFSDPQMAFGILSLCTDAEPQTPDNFTESMANMGQFIREAQHKTYLQFVDAGDKNVGFVSTYDLRRAWYHPWLKIPAGERAARWALVTQYDKGNLQWEPARSVEMTTEAGQLVLHFDKAIDATGTGLPMKGFAIAGKDRKFYPADATHRITGQDSRGRDQYDRTIVILTSPMVPEPVAYRYAWARNPMGNVQGAGHSDIPLPTQRSDDWPIEDTPLGVFGDDPPTAISRPQWNTLREVLRQIDHDRRLQEARTLIEQLEKQD